MDPIKVDFSDSGKKKSVKEVLLPPEKAGLKITINIIVMLLTAAIGYYFFLPPLNFKAYKLYLYIGIVAASYILSAVITSGAVAKPEYVPYVKRHSIAPAIVIAALLVVVGVGYLVSCPFFRASSYAKILDITNKDNIADAVSYINDMDDFKNVALIDKDAATALADKQLGDFAGKGLESQFELNVADSTQINYKNIPTRVYPLQYGDIFKWFLNSVVGREYEGIPGYVRVDMNSSETTLITDYDIKYSTAEHFNEYLMRHIRFRFPTYIIGEISFEVNDDGNPYWIVEVIDKTIGLFGGDDVTGIIVVDAVNGNFTEYNIVEDEQTHEYRYFLVENNKTSETEAVDINWIDQAFDANLLVAQANYWGRYINGFWNSVIGQSNVRQASDGYSFLAMNDDVYLYTGVTSVTNDNSILGFFLINQRTKEAMFYSTTGATENAAMKSANDKMSDKGWTSTFPLLLNIDGQPTYFMAYKGDSNVVKSYAFVNVNNYQVVSVPQTEGLDLAGALKSYIDDMNAEGITINVNFTKGQTPVPGTPDDKPNTVTVTGVVADIRSQVVDGTTWYYITLNTPDLTNAVFYCAAEIKSDIVFVSAGSSVSLTYDAADTGVIKLASNVKLNTDAAVYEKPVVFETTQPAA